MFPLHSRLQLHSSGFFPGEQGSKYKAICICTYERMALGWLTFLPVAAFRKQALRTNDGYGFNRNTRIRSKAEYGRPDFTSVNLRVIQVTVSLQHIRNSQAANEILFLNEVDAQLEIPGLSRSSLQKQATLGLGECVVIRAVRFLMCICDFALLLCPREHSLKSLAIP